MRFPLGVAVALAIGLPAGIGGTGAHAQGTVSDSTGHTVTDSGVVVDRAEHWREWTGASSLVDISARGITPRLVRKEVNAAADAGGFGLVEAGGIEAGSRSALARSAIDGNIGTSWGPDPQSPLSDWWVEVRLGRLVVAKKVIVRFADTADPFLQFRVLGWRHPPPGSTTRRYELEGTRIPVFWEIGRTARPAKTQRVFEFDVRSTEGADALFVGDPIDRLQILATATDSSRAEEVSEEVYEDLTASQRGAVQHFRRELSGRETPVTEAEYAAFDSARQGPIRYYRREIPRIAEIEVITEGDNVNIGLVERGGSGLIQTVGEIKDVGAALSDAHYSTAINTTLSHDEINEYEEDLGALFWVDTIHLLADGPVAIDEMSVDISDGSRAPNGRLRWRRAGNSSSQAPGAPSGGLRYREIRIEPSKVRHLRVRFQNPGKGSQHIGFNEVLLYGGGYVPEVTLTSDLIEFDDRRNLLAIDWRGEVPAGTRIALQTRSGDELDEEKIYHDSDNNAITEARFRALPPPKKGEVTSRFVPGGDWNPWSTPYSLPGDEITSPSPRQYMQIRATLTTDRPDAAASLRSVTVRMASPVVDRLVGEIWPVRAAAVDSPEVFSLYIRPEFGHASQAFDEIKIEATTGTSMELIDVRKGSFEEFEAEAPSPVADVEPLPSSPDTLRLRLRPAISTGTDLVEVRLRAALLGNSASFRAFVRRSTGGDVWQRVDEGDANPGVPGQTVTVLALEGSEIITGFRVVDRVVSPNGDDVNEQARLRFSVARVSGAQAVTMTVYDLRGRRVRRIEERRDDARGEYEMAWNGQADGGATVPPGIYVARVDVDVELRDRRVTHPDRRCCMWSTERRARLAGLVVGLALAAGPGETLVIYRIGGQSVPPPDIAGTAGVRFERIPWADPSSEVEDLDVSTDAIRPLRRDPTFNIAPTAEARGGEYLQRAVNGAVWDGDTSTVWTAEGYLCANYVAYNVSCTDDFGTHGTANIDLGGLFRVHRIVLVSGLRDPGTIVKRLRVYANRENPHTGNFHPSPFSPFLVEIRDNRDPVLEVHVPLEEDVSFVQVTLGERTEEWEVHDIHIYAKGFVGRASYRSQIIDLGQPMAWGQLRWSGGREVRARVQIQTRSGNGPGPLDLLALHGPRRRAGAGFGDALREPATRRARRDQPQHGQLELLGRLRLRRQRRHGRRVAEPAAVPAGAGGLPAPRR